MFELPIPGAGAGAGAGAGEELLLCRWRRCSVPLTWGPIKGRRRIRRRRRKDDCTTSSWDDKPYCDEQPPSRRRRGNRGGAYSEEQDIVTFLDPPKQLIPLDPSSYNPAAYLWNLFLVTFPRKGGLDCFPFLNPGLATHLIALFMY